MPVRVPNAARYCLHKLIVASLRGSRAATKADKDIAQSAVLAAVLREKFEGDLLEAVRRVPASARKHLAQGARRAAALLSDRHVAGKDFLEGLCRA